MRADRGVLGRIMLMAAVIVWLMLPSAGLGASEPGKARIRRVERQTKSRTATAAVPVTQSSHSFLWGVSTAGHQYEGSNAASVCKKLSPCVSIAGIDRRKRQGDSESTTAC